MSGDGLMVVWLMRLRLPFSDGWGSGPFQMRHCRFARDVSAGWVEDEMRGLDDNAHLRRARDVIGCVVLVMPLITLRNVSLAYGGPKLLESIQMTIEPRERVCLVGRNGEGKSSLLKVISGEVEADSGEFERLPSLKVAKLEQEATVELPGTVYDVVTMGAGDAARLLSDYHHCCLELGGDDDEAVLARMDALQHQLEASGGWQLEQRIDQLITRLGLPGEDLFNTLSGGMKRRTLLARALVNDPDLLLLDEPTNHLDIESIRWLEEFLEKFDKALLFITHDRSFLRKVATRILELDRGQLTSWDCGYDKYLERKEALLEAEATQNAAFDKKLSQEEVWIRKGIQARRTRNEGRVRTLKKMRDERSGRREMSDSARFNMQDAQVSGRKVIVAEDLGMSYEGNCLISGFSTTIWRGDKIGLLGRNGSGKTTLLKLLLKELQPESGSVEHGTQLTVSYYDQLRTQLDDTKTAMENVWDKSDTINFNGKPMHVLSYLQTFLFSPERARSPINKLSGGERNRLLLAKLFVQPANLLVMDEPTNDLDIETIELLEELLLDYQGTLLLVSHDRAFLNNVVTSCLALEGKGVVREYNGGYEDYERHQIRKEEAVKVAVKQDKQKGKRPEKKRKMLKKEREELESLPGLIEQKEAAHEEAVAAMAEPDYFQKCGMSAEQVTQRLKEMETELEALYARWEELEALRTELEG